MPSEKKEFGNAAVTGALFETGASECDHALRIIISAVLRESALSREQVADGLTAQVGLRVSEQMLNCWTAESKEKHRFPASFIPAFCRVTGDFRLIHFLNGKLDFLAIDGWQKPVLELGERMIATKMSEREVGQRIEEIVAARSRA